MPVTSHYEHELKQSLKLRDELLDGSFLGTKSISDKSVRIAQFSLLQRFVKK